MTENEALEILNNECEDISKVQIALKVAREALEEIQQYRAIGTIEEFKTLKEKSVAKKIGIKKNGDINFFLCPQCDKLVGNSIMRVESSYCSDCGQKLDWSE